MLDIVRKKGDISQIDALQDLLRRIREYDIQIDRSSNPPSRPAGAGGAPAPAGAGGAPAPTAAESELANIKVKMEEIASRGSTGRFGNTIRLSEQDKTEYNRLSQRRQELENSGVVASPEVINSLRSMEDMANEATNPGSIYTHDVHSESLLTDIRDLLSSNSTSVSNRYGSSDIEAINTQFKKLIESLVVSNQNPEGTFINRRNTTPAVASNSISNTISLDEKSSSILNGFIGKFGEYVNQLSQFNFPSKIEIKGNYNMNVNITGAEAFQQMGVDLKAEIEEIYGPAFEYIWKNTNGNLVRRNVSTRNKR
jgi:hypothetical protein